MTREGFYKQFQSGKLNVDSKNSIFSFQDDFSFQTFLEQGKKNTSQNKVSSELLRGADEAAKKPPNAANEGNDADKVTNESPYETDNITNESPNENDEETNELSKESKEAIGELIREALKDQRHSQFKTGALDKTNSHDEESKSGDNSNPSSSDTTDTDAPAVFKMGATPQSTVSREAPVKSLNIDHITAGKAAQAQEGNEGIYTSQLVREPEKSASSPDVMAGSRVSHGTNMSEQMKARQAGKQAENKLLSEQMARQTALISSSVAEAGYMAASGNCGGAVGAAASIRSDRRVDFEKKRNVYETADADFKKIAKDKKEEKKEEVAEVVRGESTEENVASSENSSGEEGTITTGSDTSTSDSSGSDSSDSDGDVTIITGSDSSDATITTGASFSATLTTNTTGYDSSATLRTTSSASADTSSSVSFKGISIRI